MWAGREKPQGFLTSYIRKVDKILAGRVLYFMKRNPRVPGDRKLMDIIHKRNSRKFIGFKATEGLEVLTQVIPIYLVTLTIILMFLFALLFLFTL